MSQNEKQRIVGIGETVYDIIFKNNQPVSATPGGSTFNSLISLGRGGVNCTMVTETGQDHIGDLTCQFMQENGIDTSYVNRPECAKSHIALAFLDDNDDAHYQFYKDHANTIMQGSEPQIGSDDLVLFGSFFAINPVIRPTVRRMIAQAHDNGALIYYDVNFRASHIADIPDVIGNIKENMQMSTIVRGSLEDFGYLYGSHDVDEIYEKHIRPYCQCFICTDGGRPLQLRTPSLSMEYPVSQIKTVSTVGAGDSFNAGFLYALMRNPALLAQLSAVTTGNPLASLTAEEWAPLIAMGQKFSAAVCQSIGNSVPREMFVNEVGQVY